MNIKFVCAAVLASAALAEMSAQDLDMWDISDSEEDALVELGDKSALEGPERRNEEGESATTLDDIKSLLVNVIDKVSENEKAIANLKEHLFR